MGGRVAVVRALMLALVACASVGGGVHEIDTGRGTAGPTPPSTPTPTKARLAGRGARRSLPGRRHYWRSGALRPNPPDSPRPEDPEGAARWDAREAKRRRQAEALLRSQGRLS